MNGWSWLTELSVLVLIIRAAMCWPRLGWPEAIGLFLVLCVHVGKLWISVSERSGIQPIQDELDRQMNQIRDDIKILENKMVGIDLSLGIKRSDVEG